MSLQQRYAGLNTAQKQAVDTIDGPVMVVAGPGTGKTELLSVRAANILEKTDSLPQNILCLTYTESGAAAMRARLVEIIGRDAYKIPVHTFHSFGSEVISRYPDYFYGSAAVTPAGELATYQILTKIFEKLPHSSVFASIYNGEFTYLKDAQKGISQLKTSGLSTDELTAILQKNDIAIEVAEKLLVPIFSDRMSKATIAKAVQAVPALLEIDDTQPLPNIPRLSMLMHDSLMVALDEVAASGKTTALTAWRTSWFKKDEEGELCLKSRDRQTKLRELLHIYQAYADAMTQAGLYDFDDMILQLVQALRTNQELKYTLQEQYLYIMVDEFQDTNLVQGRILHELTDNPVHEGRPNIMVVGDDDQAIYSFQGAEISNILEFDTEYRDVARIVLTENYRSTAPILGLARQVVVQGEGRLETHLEGLSKELTAHNTAPSTVAVHQATTPLNERAWIARQIAQDIQSGVPAAEIAVLARRHADVEPLLNHLAQHGVPFSYDRQDNVLELEPIIQLENIAQLVLALAAGNLSQVDSLLPEVISHPAWGFSPHELWQLAVTAYERRDRWFDTLTTLPRFADFSAWLIELAAASRHTPLEVLLDTILGRSSANETFTSPLYAHFFSNAALRDDPERYLVFLTGLQTLREQLLAFTTKQSPTLQDFVEFTMLHRQLGIAIRLQSASETSPRDAVRVMTAHAAKGLEFEHVYIMNATDAMWGERRRGRTSTISFPENLAQLEQVGESTDEKIRLFYVALTRAKRALHISYSAIDEKAKPSLRVSFLENTTVEEEPLQEPQTTQELTAQLETDWYTPLVQPNQTLKDLLAPTLASYKLSATHLHAFVDFVNAGPQQFLLNCLLHFPQAQSPQIAYGNAIHATLRQAHEHFVQYGSLRPVEDSLGDFAKNLQQQRMAAADYEHYVQRGYDELRIYLAARQTDFLPTQKAELRFSGQNAMVGDVLLTGSIDLFDADSSTKTAKVIDYKTGAPALSWKASSPYRKIQLNKYRQQLIFYKILVESSRDYSTYTVTHSALDFVKPTKRGEVVRLETDIATEDVEHLQKLISAVWKHIMELNFPDTAHYAQNYQGILQFEQDLIDGVV